jgi:GAF domain-containing protein
MPPGMREERAVLEAVAGARDEIAREALDLRRVMQLACDTAIALVGADAVAVDLVDGDELVVRAVAGWVTDVLGVRLGLGSSLAGQCVRTGRAIRCGDTLHDPRSDLRYISQTGFWSVACVPITDYGLPVGVVTAAARRERAFRERDVAVLGLLAEVVGAHLD